MSDATKVYPYNLVMSNIFDNVIKIDKKFKSLLNKCSSGVKLVIFEESGIDLVDYMSGIAPDAGWFYFISTKNIIQSSVLKMKESGPSLQVEVNKSFVWINDYLKKIVDLKKFLNKSTLTNKSLPKKTSVDQEGSESLNPHSWRLSRRQSRLNCECEFIFI